jgi:4-diphosphocytidyl-2-C-methyl-D-erythritol kinase
LIYFPPAKINLGLRVLEKREDGFHNIESIFLPTQLCDVLEVHKLKNGTKGELNFECSGVEIIGNIQHNTVVKAHQLLSEKFKLPALEAKLQKFIPTGAGLGGGSSDGSFMLKAINGICKLGLRNDELEKLAAELGSDCPFFINNTPTLVRGRGEALDKLPFDLKELNLEEMRILIIHPNVHVNTSSAFTLLENERGLVENNEAPNLKPSSKFKSQDISDLTNTSINKWSEIIVNDFQKPVAKRFDQINKALNLIEDSGADYIQMTGSGSAVYGLFKFMKAGNSLKDVKTTQNVQKIAENAHKLGYFTHFGALA